MKRNHKIVEVRDLEVNKTCTPVLLSDLSDRFQRDWLVNLSNSDRRDFKNGDKDFIIGYYNDKYNLSLY